jgi:hypothetical protein
MKFVNSFGQFLITQWVWAVTFARAQPLINMLVMLLILLVVSKVRVIPAVLYAFFSQFFALVLFTLFVHGVLDKMLGITFVENEQPFLIHPLATTFLLAMIYTALQTLFFYILSYFYALPVQKYARIAFVSNVVSMFVVYRFMSPY